MDQNSSRLTLLQRAEAAAHQGRDDEARHLLKAVLRHDSINQRALLWLVYLAEDGQASLNYLARLLDANPRHPRARTAIRWARRRTPTTIPAPPKAPPQPIQGRRILSRWPRGAILSLGLLALLIGLGMVWQAKQSPPVSVQAHAPAATRELAAREPALREPPTPTNRSFTEIVKISIPLFTPTPTPSPTPVPDSALVPVIGHPQSRNLSCESRSVADLAGYWGTPVNELQFLADLGQSDNPHKGFVGDVDQPPGSLPPFGYGVYAEPVAATLRDYGLNARAVYNLGLEGLRRELLAERPVMIWATYGMQPYEPLEWVSSDGQVSTVIPFMHTFLVTGFDQAGVFVLDAYDTTVQYYPASVFLDVWNMFDQMAVVVNGPLTNGE
jgi:uncharacterized protein YvpB